MLVLREALKPLTGDGDHLVYNFGRWQTSFVQCGGDYPRHKLIDAHIPITQACANPDLEEVKIKGTELHK